MSREVENSGAKDNRREKGMALISAVVMIAVITAVTADLAYDAQVDLATATNARDELRAHYLARSSINLGRMLLRVQDRLIGPNSQNLGGFDLQLADYAPYLISAFNSSEGAQGLTAMLGLELGPVKGLGIDVGTFDLEMISEDGKLNLNCAGGANPGAPAVLRTARALMALMLPQRYDRLFQEPRADGAYVDRNRTIQAIVDWIDQDPTLFGTSGAEDYRYTTYDDPYENKNQYLDTLEELRLVEGVDDDFMSAFGKSFTIYGGCKVSISAAEAPLIAALIMQFAESPQDPALRIENLALLARTVVYIRELMGGFTDTSAFVNAVEDPNAQLTLATAVDTVLTQGASDRPTGLPPVTGVKMKKDELSAAIVAGTSRRIWKLTAMAEVGRVRKRLIGVWDTRFVSSQARPDFSGPGGFVYWREE